MRTILIIILFASMLSCDKTVKKKAGKIDVQLVIYNDPLNNIYDVNVIPISTLYFKHNHVIEQILDESGQSFIHVFNNMFCIGENIEDLISLSPDQPLADKKCGIRFVNDHIDGYDTKELLSDTSFNGYNYKRIAIANDSVYTLFYVHQTDTILPFSLGSQLDNEFKGQLNRVDVFDKRTNVFSSLRMSLSDTIPITVYNILNQLKDEG